MDGIIVSWAGRKYSRFSLISCIAYFETHSWNNKTSRPSIAEILVSTSFSVKSFPKRWLPEQCEDDSRIHSYISNISLDALAILKKSMMSLINAKPPKSVTGVVDGFIVWRCENDVLPLVKTRN